jgi:iron complex outermembrane receptor protein
LYAGQTRQARELRDTTRHAITGRDEDAAGAVLVRSGGNAELRPEKAMQFAVEAAWMPSDRWEFGVAAFEIDQSDVIAAVDAQSILDHEPLYTGLVQRHAPSSADVALGLPGALIAVDSSFRNIARQRVTAVDLHGRYRRNGWRAEMNASWMARFEERSEPGRPAVDLTGGYARPRWRGIAGLYWEPGRWSAGAELEHTGNFADAGGWREVAAGTQANFVVSRHFAAQHLTFHLRVDNIADRAPPFADNVQGFAGALHDPRGRVISVGCQWRR